MSRGRRIHRGLGLLVGFALAVRLCARLLPPAGPRYRFRRSWRETIRLRDGTKARLRLIRPEDKPLVVAGMQHLSPESRYRRFHDYRAGFSDAELRYLTEVDGVNHFALGAMRAGAGPREGLGVARFVRLPDLPGAAEAALVVADEAQGQGLGSALFLRLMEAARERGIHTLRCHVLASNAPMLHLLARIAPDASAQVEGATVTVDISL